MSGPHDKKYVGTIQLTRADENAAEINALGGLVGDPVGVDAVLDDLNRQGRRALAPGRAVSWALTWDRHDRCDSAWWPQGITTSADACDTDDISGRRVVAVSWYAKNGQGSRITFIDLGTHRYRHVLLVQPLRSHDGSVSLEPLRVHAGGIVWCGPYLHVAATGQGFMTCRVDDILRIPDRCAGDASRLGVEDGVVSSYGYRYVLPVRFTYEADTASDQERMRYSFMSLDRGTNPPELVVGEYARGDQTRRLARFRLDPESHLLAAGEDGVSRPLMLDPRGVARTQGAAVARGNYYLTASNGPSTWGSVYSGRPGDFRPHRWAAPMGPEDIAYWPSTDRLWSVTELPGRRWVYSMRRSWFD